MADEWGLSLDVNSQEVTSYSTLPAMQRSVYCRIYIESRGEVINFGQVRRTRLYPLVCLGTCYLISAWRDPRFCNEHSLLRKR